MADWPQTLPAPLVDGASYAPQENTIRTQMAAGAAKMRRRFTAVSEIFDFTLRLTDAQVDTLDAFVVGTLKDVLPFTWVNFRLPGSPAASYRFVQRPVYTAVPGAYKMWDAQIQLERLP